MIYVSSSCVKGSTIAESVEKLFKLGYRNIELSGGTKNYSGLTDDLLELKSKYNLNFLCHNYFPPPSVPFVVNLASPDPVVANLTINHLKNAISLSSVLGAKKFGFHAGFLINIPLNEIGRGIQKTTLHNRDQSFNLFCERFRKLSSEAGEIELYVENNVLSKENYRNYEDLNPFFITDLKGLEEFLNFIDFKPLLDVAHLKVSCKTLGLNLKSELDSWLPLTDYIHISDNDGNSDNNRVFVENSELFELLSDHNFSKKVITLEVYSGEADIETSYRAAERLLRD